MAGESVALNPALRERNRNLKGCGLTGLLFWVGIAPATLRYKKSRQSPRWGCAGASSEGGKGFSEGQLLLLTVFKINCNGWIR